MRQEERETWRMLGGLPSWQPWHNCAAWMTNLSQDGPFRAVTDPRKKHLRWVCPAEPCPLASRSQGHRTKEEECGTSHGPGGGAVPAKC